MAKGRPARRKKGKSGGGPGKALAALAFAAAIACGGVYLFEQTRNLPQGRGETVVTQGTMPAPAEPERRTPAPASPAPSSALGRKPSEAPALPAKAARTAPFGISEEVFEAGARVYNQQRCAGCHGRPGKNGTAGNAEQFWNAKDARSNAAASRPAGEIYQAIAVGTPAKGMPAYEHSLSDTELWDLSLLLKSSRGDLPDPVLRILRGGL